MFSVQRGSIGLRQSGSRDVLDRISAATMRRFTQYLNEVQSDRVPSESQPATEISSGLGLEQPSDIIDLVSHSLQPHQFENEDIGSGPFSPFYRAPADYFTGTDVLSYFMGSRGGIDTGNAEMPGEYYPSVDEVVQNFFGDGIFGFGHDQ